MNKKKRIYIGGTFVGGCDTGSFSSSKYLQQKN